MTFDSLGGNHHVAIDALRSYLRAEALDKKSVDLENKPPIRGKTVPVCPIPFFSSEHVQFPFSVSRLRNNQILATVVSMLDKWSKPYSSLLPSSGNWSS